MAVGLGERGPWIASGVKNINWQTEKGQEKWTEKGPELTDYFPIRS